MELWKILFGLLTAALLIHFRGAYLRAQKQQLVATRLHSYLLYWRSWVIDNEAFSLFYIGAEWNKEIRELLKKGDGAAALVALKDKKREMIKEIRGSIEKEDHKFDVEPLKKQLSRLPTNSVDHILKHCQQFEQNLLDGKTFVTDEDACALGPYYAQLCVDLKMNLISGANKLIGQIVLFLGAPDQFTLKDAAKEISEIFWKGILISKDIDELSNHIEKVSKHTLLELTWKNLRL